MATIGALTVDLQAATAAFQADLGKARAALNSNTAAMNRTLGSLEKGFAMVTRAAGAVGIALSVGALVAFTKRSLDAAGGLGELAEQFGISTDALQTYQFAAVQTGNTVEELRTGFMRLSRTIGDAREGQDQAVRALRAFGPEVEGLAASGASTERIFAAMADRIASIEDPAKRAALATAAFGESGAKLLPMMSNGSAGLKDMADQLDRLGLRLTPEMIKQADEASDAIAAMTFEFNQLAMELVSSVAPAITDTIRKFRELGQAPDLARMEKRLAELRADRADLEAQRGLTPPGVLQPQITALDRQIASLEGRIAALKRSATEAAAEAPSATNDQTKPTGGRLVSQRDLDEEVAAQEKAANEIAAIRDRLYDETRMPFEAYQQDIAQLNQLLDAGIISWEVYQRSVAKAGEELAENTKLASDVSLEFERQKALMEELESFGTRAFDRIGEAITEMMVQGKASAFEFRNVMLGIVSELMQEFIKLSIMNPLKNAVFGRGLPSFGDLFGGGGGSIPPAPGFTVGGTQYGGPRAAGGPVAAGVSYRVGEYGPETFVAPGDGAILPADAGGTVVFNQTFNFGAGMSNMDRAAARRFAAESQKRAVAAVADLRMRGNPI